MRASCYYYDQNPSSFCVLVQIGAFQCYLNLAGITKFKCERKNEKNSGRGSKMTPSCKCHTSAKGGLCSLPMIPCGNFSRFFACNVAILDAS